MEAARDARNCANANKRQEPCAEGLDEFGCHALTCGRANCWERRHRHVVQALQRELARYGVSVEREVWVDGLAQKKGKGWREARLDLVVRDGRRVWYLDFSCFHPFAGPASQRARGACFRRQGGEGGWSLRQREGAKHKRYRTKAGGRRLVEGRLVPIISNSFSAVGEEARAFFAVVYGIAHRLGREVGRDLESFVQSSVAYFTAQNVAVAYGHA